MQGGGARDPAWIIFFVEVQWMENGSRRIALAVSLTDAHFPAMGKRGVEDELL